jgi:prepilin-type N-terminal cleavage/methylation domain-containing protein
MNSKQFIRPNSLKFRRNLDGLDGQTVKYLGFTLIELLVVVAIIALLGAIIVVNIKNTKAKSRDVRRLNDIKSIQEALAMYHNDAQMYPIYDGYITGDDDMSQELIEAGVITTVPVDPLNTNIEGVTYKYYYQSSDGTIYLIEYYLETDSISGKAKGLNTASP